MWYCPIVVRTRTEEPQWGHSILEKGDSEETSSAREHSGHWFTTLPPCWEDSSIKPGNTAKPERRVSVSFALPRSRHFPELFGIPDSHRSGGNRLPSGTGGTILVR